jgi:hypothetical protein
LDIPFVYADEGLQHDELLAKIIKWGMKMGRYCTEYWIGTYN